MSKIDVVTSSIEQTGKSATLAILDSLGFGLPSVFKNSAGVLNDALYHEKVTIFLENLDGQSTQDKIKFYNETVLLDKDRFYKNVFMKLDSINEMERIAIFANLFRATISNKISQNQWERLSYIITSISYLDIHDFQQIELVNGKIKIIKRNAEEEVRLDNNTVSTIIRMVNCGFMVEINQGTHTWVGGNSEYQLTEIGELFLKYKDYSYE